VKSNTHSLPRWRVNGPLSNMPQFAKAFGCKNRAQWSEKMLVGFGKILMYSSKKAGD
jgi:hypothetical protein